MKKRPPAHPSNQELAAFVSGNLNEEDRIAIEQHIETCQSCCEAMESVPDDTWVGRMRQAETAFDGSRTPATRDLSHVFDEHSRYRLIKKLGQGGMGEVYLAEHRLMERLVALKVIRSELVSNSAAVARFRQEVKAAAKLSHRGIVTAHDAEEAGGMHFLVMEYVEGMGLDEVVAQRGRLPVMHACNYIRQAAIALQHAHEHGMVHRDVKPHNLMLCKKPSGIVKILDFGLTRIANQPESPSKEGEAQDESGLTAVGTTIGTPDYMAPEQIQDSRQADIRSDIYSLGCTLYFLLTGRPPFPQGTIVEKLSHHVQREPTSLDELRDDVPPELVSIAQKMMDKDPARRMQTPMDVARALEGFAKPAEQSSSPPTPPPVLEDPRSDFQLPAQESFKTQPRSNRVATRRRVWIVAGLSVVLLIGFLGVAALFNARTGRRILYVVPPKGLVYDDYAPVRDLLESSGIEVQVASSQRQVSVSRGPTLRADLLLEEIEPGEFDAIVFAGGEVWEYSHGQHSEWMRKIVQAMVDDNKPIAAMAVGQKVLAATGFFQGRRVAYRPGVDVVAPNSGAIWVQEPVVVSDKLITARDPQYGTRFAQALIDALGN